MITANRRIPVMAGAAALVLIVVWYFMLWSPQAASVHKADKARAAAEQRIGSLRTQVSHLQALVKQIPADNARLAQLETALPDSPQLDQALNLLHQAAQASGVTLATLAPSTPAGSGGPGAAPASGTSQTGSAPVITLNMNVMGNPGQVRAFLALLTSLPRTVVVDRVTLSGGNSTTANIAARIFYAGHPTP